MKNIKNVLATRRSNRGLFLKLSVFAFFGIMILFSGQTLAQTPTPTPIPTPTPGTPFCVPTAMVTESGVIPGGGGIASFSVGTAANAVTIQHVIGGTGLRVLSLSPTAPAPINTVPVIPPIPAVGTFGQVVVTFSPIMPGQPVDFTLRAASLFHDIEIRVRCLATCTPTITVTESPTFPGGGGLVSFPTVTSGAGFVRIQHAPGPPGTGLQTLMLSPNTLISPNPTNAVLSMPFVFTPGTFLATDVFFSVPDPTMVVAFQLRAASTFHDIEIIARCPAPMLAPEEDKNSN